MTYTHLTQAERYQIYALKKAGHSQVEIAQVLDRSRSTISRELRRNLGKRGYRPKQAHLMARERQAVNARTIDEATWALLWQQWSPEQIGGQTSISTETVYQHVYADKRAGGSLWRNLRCQKQRKKRYGKRDRQLIVSIVERKSGFTLIRKVERKTAQAVSGAMIELLKPYRPCVLTITSDNGREFARHEEIAKQLQTTFYFAHPYASWERGTNENTNGLTRQYFPKNRDFTTITQQEIDSAMERLNNRPRKRLGFLTPSQVFFNSSVAFLS